MSVEGNRINNVSITTDALGAKELDSPHVPDVPFPCRRARFKHSRIQAKFFKSTLSWVGDHSVSSCFLGSESHS